MASALVVCSDCKRWSSSGGAPVCGICRASRAIQRLTTDPRVTSANYDLILSILDRSLGEVNGWLAVPLAEFGEEPSEPRSPPESGEKRGVGETSSEESSGKKHKRSSRDEEKSVESSGRIHQPLLYLQGVLHLQTHRRDQ